MSTVPTREFRFLDLAHFPNHWADGHGRRKLTNRVERHHLTGYGKQGDLQTNANNALSARLTYFARRSRQTSQLLSNYCPLSNNMFNGLWKDTQLLTSPVKLKVCFPLCRARLFTQNAHPVAAIAIALQVSRPSGKRLDHSLDSDSPWWSKTWCKFTWPRWLLQPVAQYFACGFLFVPHLPALDCRSFAVGPRPVS